MIAEIEADMAVQLARVREMERNGELEPIPERRWCMNRNAAASPHSHDLHQAPIA